MSATVIDTPYRRSLPWQIARSGRVHVGLAIMALPLAIAVFGPVLAPYSPTDFVGAPFSPVVDGTLFGSDDLGRDVWSRFLAGGQMLLLLAAAATIIGVAIGAVLGCLLAYQRGAVDAVAMRLADVALAFPPIVLALMCLSLVGPTPGLIVLVVALGHVPRTLRVIRGTAMGVVGRDFVRYGETLGIRPVALVVGDVLPNVAGPLMVELGIRFTYSIGLIAGLGFLGLGVPPPNPDWGNMINENRIGITVQLWGVLLPLIAIAVLAIGCNLATDGIARVAGAIEKRTADG